MKTANFNPACKYLAVVHLVMTNFDLPELFGPVRIARLTHKHILGTITLHNKQTKQAEIQFSHCEGLHVLSWQLPLGTV